MTNKHKFGEQYYHGGLAELVIHPSPLTFSYFSYWLTGSRSLGQAMKLLHLPHRKLDQSVLSLQNGQLVVDASIEEDTLYASTILSYHPNSNSTTTPKLRIDLKKLPSLSNINNTIKIIFIQASWISSPEKTYKAASNWIDDIPTLKPTLSIPAIEKHIINKCLPVVLAVGYLAQYYSQLNQNEIQIDSDHDWFFRSINDRQLVKSRQMSLVNYLDKYGLRADNDYELTMPRWYEQPDRIKKQIQSFNLNVKKPSISSKSKTFDPASHFQLLRSEAKRKFLIDIDLLRQAIISKYHSQDISHLTRDQIISGQLKPAKPENQKQKTSSYKKTSPQKNGQGRPVSSGVVTGKTQFITNPTQSVKPGIIGIFPNASPMFAIQYPACSGLIFASGGMTSHGSIVAREYSIPAIIFPDIHTIPLNQNIYLDGSKGIWQLTKKSY